MPPTTSLLPDAAADAWRGVVDWERRADGRFRAWRLLPDQAERAHAPDLVRHATMAAGVRAEVTTAADALTVELDLDHEGTATLDVVVDGDLLDRCRVEPGTSRVTVPLPPGEHHVELWLPQVGQSWLTAVDLSGPAVAAARPATRWSTYGSSITQCSAASGPSRTWPAIVARTLGWDLSCFGFSGQCHLDAAAARTIASTPADVVSLCLGINVLGKATLSERTFPGTASAFVEQVRAAHPEATIVVVSPIASPDRESTPNEVGLTLVRMRTMLTDVVSVLSRTDDRLFLVDGLDVLGVDEAHHLPDGLHPDAAGYELMGDRLAATLGGLHASTAR